MNQKFLFLIHRQRKAWKGKCLVVVKSTQKTGKIILKASSKGLQSSQVIIEPTK